ncbi:MAG: hypothetical protein ABI607_11115 [Betaproteobacteria bacterium]
MKTSTLLAALYAAAGLSIAGGALAQAMSPAHPMNKDARDTAYKSAESQYKMDKALCDALSSNAKDICVERAKGKEKVAKADADANFDNTPKTREGARVARADAAYDVAKEKCDDLSGNAKDVCVKEAKAAHVKATADAKVDRVAADTRNSSSEKVTEARRDAANDKRDADYKVAVEKCDALAGAAKDACIRTAKTTYGKS